MVRMANKVDKDYKEIKVHKENKVYLYILLYLGP